MLPVKYVCHSCDATLYEMRTPLQRGKSIKTPQEVIDNLEGICPYCHRKLVLNDMKIEVEVLDEDDCIALIL